MYCGRDFKPMNQDESRVYGFDFVNDLGSSEKLVSTTWAISVVQGADSFYPHRLQGAPFLFTPDGAVQQTGTMQRIGGLIPGVTYCVRAIAVTSDGDQVSLRSHIYGEAVR